MNKSRMQTNSSKAIYPCCIPRQIKVISGSQIEPKVHSFGAKTSTMMARNN